MRPTLTRDQTLKAITDQQPSIQAMLTNAITQDYVQSNDNFIKFKFLEILNVKYVPWNNGRGHIE